MRRGVRRSYLWVVGGAVALFCIYFGSSIYARAFPRANFESITGIALPPGVRVVSYESEFCDNLFKKCYFWTLDVPPGVSLPGSSIGDANEPNSNQLMYLQSALAMLEPNTDPKDVAEAFIYPRYGKTHYRFVHKNGRTQYYYVGTL